jgi:hypothetical protein
MKISVKASKQKSAQLLAIDDRGMEITDEASQTPICLTLNISDTW